MTQYEIDNAKNLKTIANAMVKIAKQLEKQNEINEQLLDINRQQEKRHVQMLDMMEDNTRG